MRAGGVEAFRTMPGGSRLENRRVRRLSILFFAGNLLLLTLLRLAFLIAFHDKAGALDWHEVAAAFYLGLKFDARLVAILTFPLLLVQSAATVYITIVELLLFVMYAVDFGSYAYVGQRLNASLLEFLRNPVISMHMVWESYHTGFFLASVVVTLGLIAYAVRRTLKRTRGERGQAGVTWLIVLGLLACIYGKVSRYPLRWSDAYFSRSHFIGDLALNPAQYLFETMREKPAAFDEARLRQLYPILVSYLGVDHPDARALNFRRTVNVAPALQSARSGWRAGAPSPPNIVLIQLESVAAFKLGVFGNPLGASPNMDALARQGYLFTQHYSPSEKTARALFAVVFGIPDVSSWQASAHNPLTVDQDSIANAFPGYEHFYFLGGSANWSNIRGMLTHNLDHLHLYEEGSYSAPVIDVWGISDEDLLLAANDVLRQQQRPFFAIIQTAGNHRPYTIPRVTHGFAPRHVPDDVLHAGHFESEEEFNGFRYLDHAVGLFMRAAQRERYFSNTIFVLYGDHGTRTGAPGEWLTLGDLSTIPYHVPLIIYAPGLIRTPRVINTPSSHVDILPTVAGLCGIRYVNQTLGIDLLDPKFAGRAAAFYFTTFHDPPGLSIIDRRGQTIVRAGDRGDNLAEAFYEASRWLLYHNK